MATAFGISIEEESKQRIHLAVQGGIDARTVMELDTHFNEALERGAVRFLVDLTSVDYVSSAGVMRLLMARDQAREAGGDLVVQGATRQVMEVFQLLGLDGHIRFVRTLEEARAVLTS